MQTERRKKRNFQPRITSEGVRMAEKRNFQPITIWCLDSQRGESGVFTVLGEPRRRIGIMVDERPPPLQGDAGPAASSLLSQTACGRLAGGEVVVAPLARRSAAGEAQPARGWLSSAGTSVRGNSWAVPPWLAAGRRSWERGVAAARGGYSCGLPRRAFLSQVLPSPPRPKAGKMRIERAPTVSVYFWRRNASRSEAVRPEPSLCT